MGETLEIAKTLVSPVNKLMDMVESAIGTIYEPKHKRKMADATAYEISVIGQALRDYADIPILYNESGVEINSKDLQRLMKRAGTRLALQETAKQHNIESVVDNAYEELVNEKPCVQEPVEQGWINRFFDSVANISDEDLQKLWGKILVSKVKNPNGVSLRALSVLKNVSRKEAILFASFYPYVLHCKADQKRSDEDYFLPIEYFEKREDIVFSDIQNLVDAGLLMYNSSVSFGFDVPPHGEEYFYATTKKFVAKNLSDEEVKFSVAGYALTGAGKEIYLATNDQKEAEQEFYDVCLKVLTKDLVEYLLNEDSSKKDKIEFFISEL